MTEKLTLGAYPAATGLPASDESLWYRELADLSGVNGLEVPFRGLGADDEPLLRLAERLPAGWHVVVTLLPLTVSRGAHEPAYGLASADDAGREHALADAAAARDAIRRLHDLVGTRVVTAVQLHSAPRRRSSAASSAGRLGGALHALRGEWWDGAALLVEHCDAARPDGSGEKAYLTLDEELAAVRSVFGETSPFGVSINWGRSAIEGRSSDAPLDHLRAAVESGMLRGLTFSGASASAGPTGGPWRDVHNSIDSADETSLLTLAAIEDSLDAAGPLDALEFVGAKVRAAPGATTVQERLVTVRATVNAVADALARRTQLAS